MEKEKMIDISFFNPHREHVKAEVKAARTVIILWFFCTFLTPILIALTGGPDGTQSFLCKFKILGFPAHYWLVAQGSTIGYILLCALFVKLWNSLVKKGE